MINKKTADTGSIKVGKFELRYQIEGTGSMPAIIIGSAIYYPRTFSQQLREHLRLVFIDHRGFARHSNNLEPSDYTLDAVLDDIEHIRTTLNLPRSIVIGHSGHGYMALQHLMKSLQFSDKN